MRPPQYILLAAFALSITSTIAAPASDTVPSVSYPYADTLVGGQLLTVNQGLSPENGQYDMILQSDGNMVISQIGSNFGASAVWASQTSGQDIDHASMQTDGNFVLYGTDDRPRWSTATYQTSYSSNGYKLVLANDGSFTIFETTILTSYNKKYY